MFGLLVGTATVTVTPGGSEQIMAKLDAAAVGLGLARERAPQQVTTGPIATPPGRQGLRQSTSESRAIAKDSMETATASPANVTPAVHGGGGEAIGAPDFWLRPHRQSGES